MMNNREILTKKKKKIITSGDVFFLIGVFWFFSLFFFWLPLIVKSKLYRVNRGVLVASCSSSSSTVSSVASTVGFELAAAPSLASSSSISFSTQLMYSPRRRHAQLHPVGKSPSQNAICPPYLVHTIAVNGFCLIFSSGKARSGENMSSHAFRNRVGVLMFCILPSRHASRQQSSHVAQPNCLHTNSLSKSRSELHYYKL